MSAINRGAAQLVASLIGCAAIIVYMLAATPAVILFIFLGPTLAILFHELGHALAAWRLGMDVTEIAVGPLTLRMKPLRLRFSKQILGEDVGGHVLFGEKPGRHLNRKTDALITLAGPLANLLTGGAAYVVGRLSPEDGPTAHLLVGFGLTSFAAFVLAAWPHKLESGRANDVLEFYRIMRSRHPPKRRAPKPKRSLWQAP